MRSFLNYFFILITKIFIIAALEIKFGVFNSVGYMTPLMDSPNCPRGKR